MIQVKQLHKQYEDQVVLNGLELSMQPQTTLTILGKSGSGKSTLLKILSGLETADSGTFLVNDEDLFALPTQDRGVVYLNQEPLLFPHLNVFDNLAFGLSVRKQDKHTIKASVEKLAGQLGLTDILSRMPTEISGGQKQRVSFGRALIIQPKILLLDEPFGSLDSQTREDMQLLFKTISQTLGMTSLFVTHDLKEALLMGDQVSMIQAGKVNVYPSKDVFVNDARTGADKEINFWNQYHAK
ncbi:MAG: ABC-type sugar transport system ATPase subunit [Paraglaciecola sp.]|jgi:ABC-type sugar transport system ATPase subunit